MKFIVSSTLLLKNLQAIGGILNSRNTMPILDDFLFELTDENLQITASDLETTMITGLKVDMAEGSGVIAIPAKTIMDLLKTFADIPISFNVDLSIQAIEISAGEGRYKMSGHNGEEFPKIPEFEETESIVLPSSTLQNAITKTVFATSNEEFRPGITGVLFDIFPEEIIFVATDAHKLVKYTKTGTMAKEAASFVVPKKPLNQLKTVLGTDEYEVKIEYNKTNVTFVFGNFQLFSRLINGAFPNYNAIIPQDNPNKMLIDRAILTTTLRRIGYFANQSTNQVRLSITGQELIISGEDSEYSSEGKDRLACEYDGQDLVIGFNSKFLLDLLSHMEAEQISMEFSAPNRAAVVLPVEEETDEKALMLISPVMLNN